MSRFGPELDVTDGLIMWLDNDPAAFDLREGQYVERWKDKSGQGNDVYQETATEQPELTGGGVSFENAALHSNPGTLVGAADAVTISQRVRLDWNTNWSPFVGRDGGTNRRYIVFLRDSNNRIVAAGHDKYEADIPPGLQGTWQHVTVVWTLTETTIYFNGVQQNTFGAGLGSETNVSFVVGSDPYYGNYGSGIIEDLRVYNRALSAEEVQILASRYTTPESGPQMKQDNLIVSTGDIKTKTGQSEWLYNDGKGRSMDQAKERHSPSMSNVERFETETGSIVNEAYGFRQLSTGYGSEAAALRTNGGLSEPLFTVERVSDSTLIDVGRSPGRRRADLQNMRDFLDGSEGTLHSMFNQQTGAEVMASGDPDAQEMSLSPTGTGTVFPAGPSAGYNVDTNTVTRARAVLTVDVAGHVEERMWTPADLESDVVLWLDASDESTLQLRDGQYVEQWSDKSGQGNHAVQGTATSQPNYVSSGDRLDFDGNDYLDIETFGGISQPNTVFFVYEPYTINSDLRLLGVDGNTGIDVHVLDVDLNGEYRIWSGDGLNTDFTAISERTIIGGIYNGNQSAVLHNGEVVTGNAGTNTMGRDLQIGGGTRLDRYSTAGYHHVLIYDKKLTVDERQKTEGYLAHKYGLSHKLPNDHPYKDNPPMMPAPPASVTRGIEPPRKRQKATARTDTSELHILSTRNSEAPWTPADLGSDLVLWLDASDESTLQLRDGQYVEQWSDKSGQGNHVYQDTATEQPMWETNKVSFDGSKLLTTEAAIIQDDWTIYILYSSSDYSQRNHFLSQHPSSADTGRVVFMQNYQGSFQTFFNNGGSHSLTHSISTDENIEYLGGSSKDGLTTSLSLDGKRETVLEEEDLVALQMPFHVGGTLDNPTAVGYIKEITVANKGLPGEKIEGYLAHKYGLSHKLPNDHPYKYNPPTE